MYKEEELLKAYEKARKGSKDYYEDFCTMMFDEVRKLVSLVYEKESNINKLVNHIFNKLRPRLNEFDPDKEDIHRWVSVFASRMIYSVYNMSNSDVFTYNESNADFEIGYIEEDDEFAECAVYYNRLMTSRRFTRSGSAFCKLTKGQVILYELFCYAGCTVEEIEDMLEVDGIYICSELCEIKKILVKEYKAATTSDDADDMLQGNGVVLGSSKEDYDDGIEYESADDYDDVDSDDDSDSDDDYDDSDDDEEDDDDDSTESQYAAYLKGDSRRNKNSDAGRRVTSSNSRQRSKKKKKSAGIMGFFESLTDKQIKLIAMGIIALILVVVLFIVIWFVGDDKGSKKPVNNGGYQQQTGQQNQTQAGVTETEGQSGSVSESAGESQGESVGQSDKETEKQTDKETQKETEKETEKESESESKTQAPVETETESETESQTESQTEAPTEAPTEESTETPTEAPTEESTEAPAETEPEGGESSASGTDAE